MGKNHLLISLFLVFALPAYAAPKLPSFKVAKLPKVAPMPSLSPRLSRLSTRLSPITAQRAFSLTPNWKAQFSAKFTPPDLHTVEEALHLTDTRLFIEKDGQILPRSNEWNYTELFAQELASLLQQHGQTLTPAQWKQLFGGTGIKGFTLANHLRLLTLDAWLLTHGGEFPRRQFSVNGRVLKPEELSEEQKLEQNLANGIKWSVSHAKDATDPIILSLKYRQEAGARKKTPEYWLDELKVWLLTHNGEYPRSSFSNGTRLSAAELTPAQKQEAALATGVLNAITLAKDPADPVIAELIRLKEAGKRYNSPEQTLAQLQEWAALHEGRMPRTSIVKNGRFLSTAEFTPEELEEKRLASRARAWTQNLSASDNPFVQQIKQLFQQASRRRSPEQVYEELQAWMTGHDGVLPRKSAPKTGELSDELQQEISLARAAVNLMYRSQGTPSLTGAKIQQLWQNGKSRVTRRSPEEWLASFKAYLNEYKHYPAPGTPEYAGVRNVLYRSAKKPDGSYENPTVQQLYELNQLAQAARRGEKAWQEVVSQSGEETPLKRFWRAATPQDRAALQATAEEMNYLREDFKDWLREAVENDWLVLSSQTYDALASVQRGLDEWFDERADEADDILVWLADTPWGVEEDSHIFSRVLFVGKNPANPRLKDFREVQEFSGVPVAGVAQLPQRVSSTTRLLNGEDVRVMELQLLPGVTANDITQALENILPQDQNYTVRMGLHELGISVSAPDQSKNFAKGFLHLHAEIEVPDEPVILSFTLEMDARRLAKGKSFAELKRLYYNLFRPYLTEDATLFLR